MIVVEDAPTAIVGAATSQKLGLITVHYEQLFSAVTDLETGATTKAREQIIRKFQSVFNDELGEFSGEVSLEVDPSVPAEQTPLRKVPLAIQDRLEAELIRLEGLGVLKRVTTPTKWVSGMVVEEKKDSQKIWLCIDPKPLNRALKRSLYPCPLLKMFCQSLQKPKSSLCAICVMAFGIASRMKTQAS